MCSLASLTPPPPPLAGSPNPRPLFYRESRFRRDALNHPVYHPKLTSPTTLSLKATLANQEGSPAKASA
jgi:hypothetical protein